jgi:hypothetical protein
MMTLYDCSAAPSPRRARILPAEEGVAHDTVQVDLRGGQLRISAHRGRHFRLMVDAVSALSWTQPRRADGTQTAWRRLTCWPPVRAARGHPADGASFQAAQGLQNRWQKVQQRQATRAQA